MTEVHVEASLMLTFTVSIEPNASEIPSRVILPAVTDESLLLVSGLKWCILFRRFVGMLGNGR